MVEVSPQYVVCNLSAHALFFCQAHVDTDTIDHCLELEPGGRHPFHWIDREQPKTAKFFVRGAHRASTHFTLSDCGNIAVTNIAPDQMKIFF